MNDAGRGQGKQILAISLAVLGIAADALGVLGAVGDWGSDTTEAALAAAPVESIADTATTTIAATTTTVPPETPQQFLTVLGDAIATGNVDVMIARLHPAVIERYGEEQCRTTFATFVDPTSKFEVTDFGEPEPYLWVTDDLTAEIPDTLTVDVVRTVDGQATSVTVHIAHGDAGFQWFSDCGSPI